MTPYLKKYLNKKNAIELLEIRNQIDLLLNQKSSASLKLSLKNRHQSFVLEKMATYWGIEPEAALTKKRNVDLMQYKHAVRYSIRSVTNMPYQKIGKMLNCDHASIIHSVYYVEDCALTNTFLFKKCEQLCEFLRDTLAKLNYEEGQKELIEKLTN